jgi:hypothetical protein
MMPRARNLICRTGKVRMFYLIGYPRSVIDLESRLLASSCGSPDRFAENKEKITAITTGV